MKGSEIYGWRMFTETAGEVALWWELLGTGPTVFLVPGRGDSSDLFPARFTDRLIAGGCSVVRYDPRDTGLSGPGGGRYTLSDLTDDADAVIAATGAGPVHLVGVSMGGMTLVDLADRRSDLVASLTFIAAMSPDPEAGMGEDFFAAIEADPVDGMLRAMATTEASDHAWVEAEFARAAERAEPRPDAVAIHQDAAFRGSRPSVDCLARIEVSALVVHGDLDRVLPLRHAESLAAGIADAELVVVSGMGHLPQPSVWDELADRTLAHVLNAG